LLKKKIDSFFFLANFGMASMAHFDLFVQPQASDYHSHTHEHVLVATKLKKKVSQKEKT
jgi:hypothetical protein